MKPIIGLTGGIGSGKSAAAEHFAKLGICIVDSDQVAREIVEPGEIALEQIRQHFGQEIIQTNGTLDRAELRRRIFADPEQRRWLEALTHPLIAQRTLEKLQAADSVYVLLVSPLLLEGQQSQLVQRILVIDAPEDLQIQRSMQRDSNSKDQIQAIMQAQMPRAERLARADDVICNDQDLKHLQQQVEQRHQSYLTLAAQQQTD